VSWLYRLDRFCGIAHRDKAAAQRYFEKAIDQNGAPETVTVDKSGANLAALQAINAQRETPIKIRQCKYLNNIVEQDHWAIKRIVRSDPVSGLQVLPDGLLLVLNRVITAGHPVNTFSRV
jgi:hypothetical protein